MTTVIIDAPWHESNGVHQFTDRNDKAIMLLMQKVYDDKAKILGSKKVPAAILKEYDRCRPSKYLFASNEQYQRDYKENIQNNKVIQDFRAKSIPYTVKITITHDS